MRHLEMSHRDMKRGELVLASARKIGQRLRKHLGEEQQESLIRQFIEINPHRPAVYEARTKDEGIPVWVLISYLDAVGGDVQKVADDYEIAAETVKAAILYFLDYPNEIAARIKGNNVPDSIIVG